MQSSVFEQLECLSPLLTPIVQEFEGLVKQLWLFALRNPQSEFSALEEQARQLHKECFASALQVASQLHRTQVEGDWLLGKADCECGQVPQYKGKQRRTLQTWTGKVSLERGYFYCRGCGTGRYPLDEALSIPAREHLSDGVQKGVCLLGAQMPFERVAHAMEELTGICVSTREVERITEERGLSLDERLSTEAQQLILLTDQNSLKPVAPSTPSTPTPSTPTPTPSTPTPTPTSPDGVWAVTLDAGKVRYTDGWHDAKAGVVFWAETTHEQEGEITGARATHQSYIAEVGSMEEAGERLAAEATRRGIGSDERVVCLGDGAASNWTQFDMHFADRVTE